MTKNIIVTGIAGFIGSSLAVKLIERGDRVIGIDNINDYYSVQLKRDRLARLTTLGGGNFTFHHVDFADMHAVETALAGEKFDAIVHLGAQAGVRYSIENPHAYVQSNLVGHVNMLEIARHRGVEHMVYASSSSVYGNNKVMPFSVADRVDQPISLYAATKKANELMAHTYSHLYGLPTTGLRFFTVYGPWGRPDMALFLFTKAMLEGRAIDVFNHGRMVRDFTYVDDIAEGVVRVLDRVASADPGFDAASPDPARSNAPYRVFNIGNHDPVPLMSFIQAIEQALGKTAQKNFLPLQDGAGMRGEGIEQPTAFRGQPGRLADHRSHIACLMGSRPPAANCEPSSTVARPVRPVSPWRCAHR